MIPFLAFALLAAACAFTMGYALNQGTTCAVTAARQVIDERRAGMLVGFGVATAAAGLIWLPLAWFTGGLVQLAPDWTIGWGLLVGAGLLGAGAVLNRACLLAVFRASVTASCSYSGCHPDWRSASCWPIGSSWHRLHPWPIRWRTPP